MNESNGYLIRLQRALERRHLSSRAEWPVHTLPESDLAPCEPTVRYAICSTPRSGSTLLSRLLNSTHCCGNPREYMNRQVLPIYEERARAEGFRDALALLQQRRTTPNGCFGIKLHYDHLSTFRRYIQLDEFLRTYRFVFIRRRDLLGQGISLSRARQVGAWHSRMDARGIARYDGAAIERIMLKLAADNVGWQLLFARHGVQFYEVVYEDLIGQKADTIVPLARFIGVGEPINFDDAQLDIAPQRDAISAEWRARFLDERADERQHREHLVRWSLKPSTLTGPAALLRSAAARVWRSIGMST